MIHERTDPDCSKTHPVRGSPQGDTASVRIAACGSAGRTEDRPGPAPQAVGSRDPVDSIRTLPIAWDLVDARRALAAVHAYLGKKPG